jgi:hypothetical protein
MAEPDLHDIALLAARTAALAIGEVEPAGLSTTTKAGHENYLTAADLVAERAILDTIRTHRPTTTSSARRSGCCPGSGLTPAGSRIRTHSSRHDRDATPVRAL